MNSNRRYLTVAALAASALSLALLSGCGSSAAAGGQASPATSPGPLCELDGKIRAVAFILPVHQGAPAGGMPEQWQCLIRIAIGRGLPISVITAEGVPHVAVRFRATPDTINPEAYADDLQNAEADLLSRIAVVKASSAGNDSWAALLTAADQLTSIGAGGANGLILSRDNLLSDSGLLRMTDTAMTSAFPAEVADYVKQHSACGRLKNLHVALYGVAEAVAPQPQLSARQRQAIASQYLAAIRGCGGTAASLPLPANGPGPITEFTTDRVTPDPSPTLLVPTTSTTVKARTTVSLLEDSLAYTSDEDEFAAPARAKQVIAAIAGHLRQHPDLHVTIRGRTSNGPTAWPSHEALGLARAELCAAALRGAGVAPARITTIGAGYLAKPPVTGPATAALNRATDFSFETR
ncbi:hypothetical protein [Kribbella speibonae]|nr:hypothetical protein [Kribbella speibonae]